MTETSTTTDPRTWAGYRAHTTARSTGTLCVLVKADEFGGDEELPWTLICHDHGGVCGFEGQRPARDHLAHPEQWCPTCQEQGPSDRPVVVKKREPRKPSEPKVKGPSKAEQQRREEERAASAEFAPKMASREQLEASIRTGLANADAMEAAGQTVQPAIIRSRVAEWQERIERGEYR